MKHRDAVFVLCSILLVSLLTFTARVEAQCQVKLFSSKHNLGLSYADNAFPMGVSQTFQGGSGGCSTTSRISRTS